MRAFAVLTAICVVATVAAGCAGKDDEAQISGVMAELRRVQDSGDAERACEQVYTVQEAPTRAGDTGSEGERDAEGGKDAGEGCRAAFEQAVEARRQRLKALRTKLVDVKVKDERATAVLRTTAVRQDGSQLERDVPYDLVRTQEGWRVRIAGEG